MYKIKVERSFSAAHQLIGYEGACENMHGHNWNVVAELKTEQLDNIGMGFDFKKLKTLLEMVLQRLDHQIINKVEPFIRQNPTAENLACYIYEQLEPEFSERVSMSSVEVSESEGCSVVYSKD